MHDMIIISDGPPVLLKGSSYVPLRFTHSIPQEGFKEIARTVLHGNECVFSRPLKKWFCPESALDLINAQASRILEDFPEGNELGDEIARLYGRE